jgi:hypothetical protein
MFRGEFPKALWSGPSLIYWSLVGYADWYSYKLTTRLHHRQKIEAKPSANDLLPWNSFSIGYVKQSVYSS